MPKMANKTLMKCQWWPMMHCRCWQMVSWWNAIMATNDNWMRQMFYLFWNWLGLAEPLVDQWYGLLVSNFMDLFGKLGWLNDLWLLAWCLVDSVHGHGCAAQTVDNSPLGSHSTIRIWWWPWIPELVKTTKIKFKYNWSWTINKTSGQVTFGWCHHWSTGPTSAGWPPLSWHSRQSGW